MKRVLLTGASGFIGRHCLLTLRAGGYEVHAVSSHPHDEASVDIHWHQASLLDATQADFLVAKIRPTHLLHFAWFAVPGRYWTSQENIDWVQASLRLLQAFARHGGQRVVMAGTCAEYDWRFGLCSEECTPLRPATLYGSSKHALQVMLDAFARQAGLSAAWGRLFFVYGPHEHSERLVPFIINSLLRKEVAQCTHGSQIRDFLFVQDAADAFVALLESSVSGPINIASGQPVRVRDIITAIAGKLNGEHFIELGTRPVSLSEPPVLLADVRRLTEELGWLPKYNIDSGIEKSLAWWRELAQ